MAELLSVHAQQVAALEVRVPGDPGSLREPDDRLRGDAFARARLADDAESLATLDRERQAADRSDDAVGGGEGDREVTNLKERHIARYSLLSGARDVASQPPEARPLRRSPIPSATPA